MEDDPDIAALVARYLDKAGFTTDRAASGRDALASLAARPPDLLILDLMLPHVDGLEVWRRVRASETTADLPIIMLTARAEESERIVGLELGADDHLAKPSSPNELVGRVRALLRRVQRGAPPTTGAITYGPILLDTERHAGRRKRYTGVKFAVIRFVCSTRPCAVQRSSLRHLGHRRPRSG